MTQDAEPTRPGYPVDPQPGPIPSNPAPSNPPQDYQVTGWNPYSAGPVWPGAPGYWGQSVPSPQRVNSANALSIVQLVAGVAILASLLLPWFDVAFGYLDGGGSATFVSLATDSEALGQVWLDLVLIGVAVALIASLAGLSMREVTRAISAAALIGFGLVVGGAGYYLAEGNAWDYSILSPGPGVYLCLAGAAVGGLAAVAHLANPRVGATSAVSAAYWRGGSSGSVPPTWAEWPGATYPGALYAGAPQPPGASRPVGTWPPQPLAPTYPEPTSALPPYASSLPVGPVGSAAQLVVLEAGQTLVLSVQPGQRLLVGRDAYAQIRLADPAVQPRHATIERQANAWVVQDLQDASPSRLWDATGSLKPVIGATTVEAGRLLIGNVLLTLYRGQP
jgi:hypothetical protein